VYLHFGKLLQAKKFFLLFFPFCAVYYSIKERSAGVNSEPFNSYGVRIFSPVCFLDKKMSNNDNN
jgi:hypothetical protein